MTQGQARTYDGRRVALAVAAPVLVASPFLCWWFVLVVGSWTPGLVLGLALCAAVVAIPALIGQRARRRVDRS